MCDLFLFFFQITLNYKKIDERACAPIRNKGDAGYDLTAIEITVLKPREIKIIRTGLQVSMYLPPIKRNAKERNKILALTSQGVKKLALAPWEVKS